MKRVIVTGASGFIGRYTLPLLVKSGFDVHALSRQTNPEPVKGVCWHHIDVMKLEALDVLCAEVKATHLLHLAWYTEHGKFWHADENIDWLTCSLELLKSFVKHGGRRITMAGSCAEYDWHQGVCSEVETPCRPATLYGASKYALYQVAAAYCDLHRVSFAWGRVFFLYGPGEVADRFVPAVINGLLRQETVSCSEGTRLRDFMHVADAADAFVALLDSKFGGAVNIASGEAYTLKQIAECIMAHTGGTGRVLFGVLPNRLDDPDVLTADVKRLNDELGWEPHFTLETGMEHSLCWWKEHSDLYHVG